MRTDYSIDKPRERALSTTADRAARRHDPIYTLSAACPLCHGALALRQTRDGRRFYVACTRRPCGYTAAYDPVISQLRDRIARLEAELSLTRMLHTLVRGEVQG